jgi:methionyl-tRNA synthetase
VKLREALQTAMGLTRRQRYLDRRALEDDQGRPGGRGRTVYTILRVIDNLKILLAPFLPFTSQKTHEYLGCDGQLFGDLHIEEYHEETRSHKALVYDGSKAIGRWEKSDLQPGQPLREPAPLIVKLDPETVEYERTFLGAPREEHEIVVG